VSDGGDVVALITDSLSEMKVEPLSPVADTGKDLRLILIAFWLGAPCLMSRPPFLFW